MNIFLHILTHNVLPLTIMIAIGITMGKVFRPDIKTLSKLNFYVFSPAMMFELLFHTAISLQLFGQVMLFFFLFMALQYAMVEAVIRIRKYEGGMKNAMRNSVLFYNSANYGIPINQLAFAGNPMSLAVQVLIMMMQNLVPNTYGIYSVNAHKADWRQIRRIILGMPTVYVIPAALLLRRLHAEIPSSIETPIRYLSDAFIGTALITLGIQLGIMTWKITRSAAVDVGLSTVLRLVLGPLIAWLLVLLLGVDGIVASALIVSSAVPTSLSSVLLAVEFDNEPEFASQTVLLSTVLSILSVTAVISSLHLLG
ncbi:AEC family transporter [Cohnella pontilimi]|uniref:AEC family transporter n=1 Tax=Cohnella pontilimi TaxID=2564100 RepID=A0A4U0FHR9_9BACL|nr:AEC family transporter [Cohnella pontilimi]TJY44517.1 AEC family transporter [Cohnella pontilimi]